MCNKDELETEAQSNKLLIKIEKESFCDPSRIVLVDSFFMVADIVSKQLASRGFKVKMCSNGRELVEYFRILIERGDKALPLVLTEYRLNGDLDGIVASEIIKHMNPAIKVILFTANIDIPSKVKKVMDRILMKPATIDEIEEAIGQVADIIY